MKIFKPSGGKHCKPANGKAKRRFLALALAMALLCSCLMPVYANSVAMLDDDFGVATMDAGFGVDSFMLDEGFGVGGDDGYTYDLAPGVTESIDEDGNIVFTWDDSTYVDWTDDDAIATPYPDGEQMDPGFAIPTNIYRFWLTEKDAVDLAAFEADIAMAVSQYDMMEYDATELYGPNYGMYTLIAVADGGTMSDNTILNPESEAGKYFAGWYTRDEFGDKQSFEFDNTVLWVSTSATIDVFAEWSDSMGQQAEQPNAEVAAEQTYQRWFAQLISCSDEAFNDLIDLYLQDAGFEAWLDNLSEDEIQPLSERLESFVATLEAAQKEETVTLTYGINYYVVVTGSAGDISATNHNWSATPQDQNVITITPYKEENKNTNEAQIKITGTPARDTTVTVTHTYTYANQTFTDTFTVNIKVENTKRTVRVNGKITLKPGVTNIQSWSWEITSGTGNITKDNETQDSVRVTGVTAGTTATVKYTYSYTYTYNSGRPGGTQTETRNGSKTYTIKVIEDSEYEPLYLYALYPTLTYTGAGTMNATSNWYGIGIAKIKEGTLSRWSGRSSIAGAEAIGIQITNGVVDLTPYSGEYTFYRNDGTDEVKNTYDGRELYPDLTYNGKTYTYWDGTGNMPENNYTIEWVELKRSNGANAGDHYHYNFPEVSSTYSESMPQYAVHHLDGIIHFSDQYLVKFKTMEPGESTYADLNPERYMQSGPGEYTLSMVILPESDKWGTGNSYDVAGETNDHKGYEWSGWFLDENLTIPASEHGNDTLKGIDDTLTTVGDREVIYYGKWIPKRATKTTVKIEKQVEGQNADQNAEFNFTATVKKDDQDCTGITVVKTSNGFTSTSSDFNGTFTLKHGEYITLSNVPIGATVTVTETNAEGYEVSANVSAGTLTKITDGKYAYTVSGATTDENPNRIVVTNTKEPDPTTTVTISKNVTGLVGDRSKDFYFEVSFGNNVTEEQKNQILLEGGSPIKNYQAIGLKHGESFTLTNVPVGATVIVTEVGAEDYEVSSDKDNATYAAGRTGENTDAVFTFTASELVTEENKTPNHITVTNHKTIVPDAGVELGTAVPYLITLGVSAAGALSLKRKRKE